jgi:hypothetical protein
MTPSPDTLMAGTRSADWYDRPNVYDPKKVHVATKNATSACRGVPLAGLRPATSVPAPLRCQGDGCRKRWPKSAPAGRR